MFIEKNPHISGFAQFNPVLFKSQLHKELKSSSCQSNIQESH